MGADPRGVLILTVRNIDDIEDKKRRISEIEGVVAVEHNNVARKLLITYEGSRERMKQIESELKGVLEAKEGAKRPRSR